MSQSEGDKAKGLRLPNRKPVFLTRRASYSQSAPSSFSQSPGLGFHTSRNVPVQSSTLLLRSLQEQLKAASQSSHASQRTPAWRIPQAPANPFGPEEPKTRDGAISHRFHRVYSNSSNFGTYCTFGSFFPYGMTTNNQSILQEAYTQVCLEVTSTGWQATK